MHSFLFRVFLLIGIRYTSMNEAVKLSFLLFQVCYGIIYGMGSKTLAEQLGITEIRARSLLTDFDSKFSGIWK